MKKIIMCSLLVAIFLSISGMKAEAKLFNNESPKAIPEGYLVTCDVFKLEDPHACAYFNTSLIGGMEDQRTEAGNNICQISYIEIMGLKDMVDAATGTCAEFAKRINDVLRENGLR